MPFLQLRITLDPSANRTKDSVFSLVSTFKNSWVPQDECEYSCGYEELNKYGEPCDPHIHFNCYFEQPDLKDPLRSAKEFLKRNAISRDFRLKGNKVWSCTLVEHPNDFRRWIRYPLKESPIPAFCRFIGDFDEMTVEARSERKRSIELNILKREKLADKISFRDKLFKHLSESLVEDNGLPDHQDIWIAVLNYYQSQGKAVCFRTVTGYTVGYQLHINAITPEQAYAMRNNPQ